MPRARLLFVVVSLLELRVARVRAAGSPDLAVAPSDVACPDAERVATALLSHVGGRVDVSDATPPAGYVVRTVGRGATFLRLQLVAADERVALERDLARPADRRPESCAALADTIALVVARYLRQIALDVPDATVPPVGAVRSAALPGDDDAGGRAQPWWAVGAGAAGRLSIADVSAADRVQPSVELFAQLRARHVAAGLSVGVASPSWRLITDEAAPNARFELLTMPVRAELGVALGAAAAGEIVALVRAGVDVLRFATTGLTDARSGVRVDPAAEVGVAWRRARPGWLLELQLTAGALLAPRDFDVGDAAPISAEPRGIARAALRVGWSGS